MDGKVPKSWQLSQTAQLDRSNGKDDTKAIRLIRMLCPLGKTFFKIVWDEAECTKYDFAHGFSDGRRREQAILIQTVTTWKLRQATRLSRNDDKSKYNHITTLRDVANAFPSPKFDRLDRMIDRFMKGNFVQIMKVRHREARMKIVKRNGDWVVIKTGCGGMQGDTTMPKEFGQTYEHMEKR